MPFRWPEGFPRIPDEDWTRSPVESLAVKYDAVEKHGWYANLDETVEELRGFLAEGRILVDYSGGTGILIDRLLRALPSTPFGVVDVDSSPKFLGLALHKLRDEERVAFRLIRYLKAEKRLQLLDEVLAGPLLDRGVDGLVSTNAIHLYYDLPDTLRSWARVVRPGGRVFIQSGNIRSRPAAPGAWIIDDTVAAVDERAREIVQGDERFARHRAVLDDAARMRAYDALRQKFFLPPRPLEHYLDALRAAGLEVVNARTRPIRAKTSEWFDFLSVYHEGVLGWVGGSERVEGREPAPEAVAERKELMRLALADVLEGRDAFDATWTYITCVRP